MVEVVKMGIKLEMLLRTEYRIKGNDPSLLARQINQLAETSQQTADEIFAVIADNNRFIYYTRAVMNEPELLILPSGVGWHLVKKVAMIVCARDEETADLPPKNCTSYN
jgi:hypothetical protein